MGGGISACVALLGSYAPRVSYCDPQTKPCTQVEVDASAQRPDVEVEYIPGFGLQRTAASVASVLLFAGGLLAIAKAEEEQEEIEPQLQLDQQIKIKKLELDANAELVNLENLAETKVRVHEQELKEAEAEMFFERNPEAMSLYLPKLEPQSSELKPEIDLEPQPEPDPLFFGVKLPDDPAIGFVEFWDWKWFNNRADDIPHIRIIAPTNGGKTTLCDWLADVVPHEERKVITVKRKPHQWVGIPVYGVPFEYHVVREQLEKLDSEMVERTRLMEKGEYRGKLSAIVDEWKAIARNVKVVKNEETKIVISHSAKQVMGDLLTLARESGIKIFALAQGRQVITWGLEGESDILECFCTVYLGSFAVEEAETVQRKFAKNSDEFAQWQQVIEFLKTQGKRAAWVETEFGNFPAIAPDLSEWKREIQSKGENVNASTVITENPAVEESGKIPTFENIPNTQHPMLNPQSPIPNPQSHDADISPDEMLKQNLDRVLAGLERGLVQPVNSRDANLRVSHPEIEDSVERTEPAQQQPITQIPPQETAPTAEEKRYTPKQFTRTDLIAIASKMLSEEVSQTKIVEQLWEVQKSRSGWSKAYREFRNLGL